MLTLQNVSQGTYINVPVFQTIHLSVKEGDYIKATEITGIPIGEFSVGSLKGQIPIGGGIQAWGSELYPEYNMIDNC